MRTDECRSRVKYHEIGPRSQRQLVNPLPRKQKSAISLQQADAIYPACQLQLLSLYYVQRMSSCFSFPLKMICVVTYLSRKQTVEGDWWMCSHIGALRCSLRTWDTSTVDGRFGELSVALRTGISI